MKLTMSDICEYSRDQLYELLVNIYSNITLEIKIGYDHYSNLSWAEAYLWALFVGESIANYCEFIVDSREGDYINFIFRPKNITKLIDKLKWLTINTEDNPKEYLEFENIYDDFRCNLENRKLNFPDIADSYWGNVMVGIHELGDETTHEIYARHPELKHYFFRSFISNNISYDFYVSEYCWIVPLDENIEVLLQSYGANYGQSIDLEEAYFLSIINLPSLIFNKRNVVKLPHRQLYQAQKCAEDIWNEKFALEMINKDGRILDIQDSKIREIYMLRKLSGTHLDISDLQKEIKKIFLSRDTNILVLCDNVCQYVFFWDSIEKINYQDLELNFNQISQNTNSIISICKPSEISCPWEKLDDEKFEQLCYDVIYSYYQLKPIHIRKMGKSRSRDGKRDIEFYTERPGKDPVKWIAQCKLIRDGSSLTASKVQDIMDTLVQYEAKGFCIMTSGIIDSTLYDKLDKIKTTKRFKTSEWSKLELERFIANHPEIRNRYF
ncbi:MAG TPA: hypothetical protein VK184_13240 [Nostocaceae cyanobacterium]|nr:hypothetical protein [Nostocaceae cyanobacterium]